MKPRITAARQLAEWFDYEPESGALLWRRSPCARMKPGQPAGTIIVSGHGSGTPYLRVTLQGVPYMATVIAWTLATRSPPPDGFGVFARDKNPVNLRLSNLYLKPRGSRP